MLRIVSLALPVALSCMAAFAQSQSSLQVAVDKALTPSVLKGVPADLRNVRATALGDAVTLTGSVDLLRTRFEAEQQVSRISGVHQIQDRIQVNGPHVSDSDLQSRLAARLHTRAISVAVHHGIVDLQSSRVDPLVAADALTLAANTPGVQGILNHLATLQGPSAESTEMPYTISSVP